MATRSIPRNEVLDNNIAGSFAPVRSKQDRKTQDKTKAENQPGSNNALSKRTIYYPTGDGKPMAEDTLHQDLMFYAVASLRYHFRTRPDVYVAGNNFLYYEEGNPKTRVSPDCYVAFGVEQKGHRRSYKVWEENGLAPAVVFEFTSRKTKKEDVTIKKPLYEQVLGVQEYFQFDPTGDYLHPRLQGQRLQSGQYQAIALRDSRMVSEQLGLELVIEGETLQFYDSVRGEWLRTYEQAETQRLVQEQRAEAAEVELARLRAEIEALRRQNS